jgi:thiol-disulfide isomerase/thioredoxin
MRFLSGLTVSLLTICGLAAATQLGRAGMPSVAAVDPAQFEGKDALDFVVIGLDGEDVQLSSLKGKVVLVEFFAPWFPGSQERIPELKRLHEGYRDSLVVLLITKDDNLMVSDFLADRGLELPIYMDCSGAAHDSYLVTGPPCSVVVGKNGKVFRYLAGSRPMSEINVALRKAGVAVTEKTP